MIITDYKKDKNYIGSDEWQYKYTNLIYKECSGLNYTAYNHDKFYGHFLYNEKFIMAIIFYKFLFDIIFLIMGMIRSLRNFQIRGLFITPILFLILIFSTPYYLYKIKKSR